MVLESAQVDKLVSMWNTNTFEVVPGPEEDDRVRPSSHQASTRVHMWSRGSTKRMHKYY